MDEKVTKLLKDLGTEFAEKGAEYKGYEVFIPVYDGNPAIGLPLVVLKKDNEVRISTPEEALEYLKATIPQDEE